MAMVVPGVSMGSIMTPLIPFNVIVDTDVGLITLLYKEYCNEEVFNVEYLSTVSRRQLVLDLWYRKQENPISICIQPEYEEDMDDLYFQLMERYYKEIIKLSVTTEMYRLMAMFDADPDIHPTILCENDDEMNAMSKMDITKKMNKISATDLNHKKIMEHNQFFFKSIGDIKSYAKHLVSDTIYIAGYGFNLSDDNTDLIDDPLVTLINKNNRITIIDLYNIEKLKGDKK